MKRILSGALAALAVVAVQPAFAQAQTAAPNLVAQPSRIQLDLAEQIIDATHVRETIEPTMRAALGQAPANAQASAAEDFVLKRMPKAIDAITVVYAQVYSENELRGILAFYQSPAGQAMIAKTPQVSAAMIPAMMTALTSPDN